MRIIALDVGDKTIGIAISDALKITAQGIEVIRRKALETDIKRLTQLINDYEVTEIVVGFPKNMNGTIGSRGEKTQEFAAVLQERFPTCPVHLWDERLTTVAAEKMLIAADVRRSDRRKVIDKLAAVIILQGYLDSQKRRDNL